MEQVRMETSVFGNIMSGYRKKYNLRQNVICRGICSGTTYLRAETEERVVDFVVQETLMARIGLSAADFEVLLDDDEFEMWAERLAIRSAMFGKQYERLRQLLEEYREKNIHKNKLHRQFCLFYEMKLAQWKGADEKQICELARGALLLTKKEDEVPDCTNSLFTPMEIELLLTLIQHHYLQWGEPVRREECLKKVISYVKCFFSPEYQEQIEGRAWMEIMKEESFESKEQLLAYTDEAIKCFARGRSLIQVAEAHFLKAKLLWKYAASLFHDNEWLEIARQESEIAYHSFDVMDYGEKRTEVEHFCEEKLQWRITTQMKSLD